MIYHLSRHDPECVKEAYKMALDALMAGNDNFTGHVDQTFENGDIMTATCMTRRRSYNVVVLSIEMSYRSSGMRWDNLYVLEAFCNGKMLQNFGVDYWYYM